MKKIIKNNIFVFILILITIILAATNYTPGTFLSGWDTLHPEFNFPEYFKRILFGVWQNHQGLGALSSQAHPSELSRMLIYYPLSFLVPLSFLRYLYFFITLILGPLGVYFFIKKAILKNESSENKIASFGGALFYLLNLGTLQHYVVPLEMFATHFATLPWLFLFLIAFLKKARKTNLLLFAIFTFFATSIAHTSTLWFAYFIALLLFLFVYNLINKTKEIRLNSFKIIAITLLINSFWLLPNLYFIVNQGESVSYSKINSLFSEEAFTNNKLFGTVPDILILKNFLFNWNAHVGDGKFDLLLKVWAEHLKNPFVLVIGYGLSAIAILGLIYSIIKKNATSFCLLAIFILCFFFLLVTNPPFGFLFETLQNTIPLFKEAIRFPFTKFSILFMFTLSSFFAVGVSLIIKRFSKYAFILIFAAFFIYMLPAFQGNFISPLMKVNIPSDYFSVFNFLNNKPYGRIATLPIHSFWGWNYYKWGYQGGGFLWFGLKDPVLEREFDRWNPNNEQYYREMSEAIYSQDQNKLNNILQKYNISYILWDKNILAPEQSKNNKVLFKNETKDLLENDPIIQMVASFGNISIYETGINNQNVGLIKNAASIGPSAYFYDDFAYAKYHNYITYPKLQNNEVLYPFRNLIDNQNRIIFKEALLPFSNQAVNFDITSAIKTDNECSLDPRDKSKTRSFLINQKSDRFIRYTSTGTSFCQHFDYTSLPRNQAYLISITSRNIQGLPLRMCLLNYISKRCDLFTHLAKSKTFQTETFFIPPIDNGTGFSINFNNFSVKNNPSINDLKEIAVYLFDYEKLSQIENYLPFQNQIQEKNVIVYSQSFDPGWKAYRIEKGEMKDEKYFSSPTSQLSSFLPFFFGKELKEHVLVNNWANGWALDSDKRPASPNRGEQTTSDKLVIIFWPQYLEYLGFGLLIGTFLWIFLTLRRKT